MRNCRPAMLASLSMVLLLAIAPARAQEAPTSDVQELRTRIERLEKQNQELMQLLQQTISKKETLPAPPAPPTPPPLDKEELNKLVEEHLQKKEEEQQRKDEIKKWEEEARGHIVGRDLTMKPVWDHGLWVETADKAFRVHVGGRTQFDTVWMSASDRVQFGEGGVGPVRDAFNFRRGRLAVEGRFFEVIEFNNEWDFINTFDVDTFDPPRETDVANVPVPTDLWIQVTRLPLIGNVRVGNQKPPISFEHLTPSRFLNFLERSLSFDAFVGGLDNGFVPGIQIFNWSENERMTWAIGVFKNNQQVFGWNVGDGEYDITGRLTWLPWYEHEGRYLIHLGLGASHRDVDSDRYRLRARTMLRNGPAPLHTALSNTLLGAESQTLIVPEFAIVAGPFSLVAEYYANWFTNTTFPVNQGAVPVNHGTTYFHGGYVEAFWFLTGEHRLYNLHGGPGAAFGRVIPHRNFYYVRGQGGNLFSAGAWQVGARYSWIDLRSPGIDGALVQDVTLGLNWFLNPNIKFQWNYSVAHRDAPGDTSDGYVHGFGMRMAVDF